MLLNPKLAKYDHLDGKSKKIMLMTIDFFEKKGKRKLKKKIIMTGYGILTF